MKTKLTLLLAILIIGCSKSDNEEYLESQCIEVTVQGVKYNVRNYDGFDKERFEQTASREQASIMQQNSNCN